MRCLDCTQEWDGLKLLKRLDRQLGLICQYVYLPFLKVDLCVGVGVGVGVAEYSPLMGNI